LLRIIVFILMLATGVVPVVLTYLVAWLVMPER
jgi:phage shock protein PspC (stress-responsive transcriptional regulator)